MNFANIIHTLSIIALPLLFAVTFHEAAHGFIASKLGDNTALALGRVTFNPAKHIDLIGTIILPIAMLVLSGFHFAFGWAKPVPINWRNLRKPRRDMVLVAAAGPLSNFIMAFLWAAIAKLAITFGTDGSAISSFLQATGGFGIFINTTLALLNLIPIPPLDGSRIISGILSPRLSYSYAKIEPYGIWILLALLILFNRFIFLPILAVAQSIYHLFGLG
jgi:Zn-dependent protease